ncbi:high mobility group box domain-containing protein [Gamsiella multidivaricata]|uniref:high mobility group box domain-containing protein n=1 Tax=Gamsiella multidivaricata TaxID=101098 RepID=UPI0022203C4C|nr:high mobility group box domain-containing protein [Gamsiella multidivaricata]KAI7826626.1 high mobility group box domain-containing protein [Gamsiella multidivaricata]
MSIVEPLPMPKRPNTSWTLFYMEHLDNVKASGKSIVPTAETAAASALWKQLSAEEKQVYEDKYRADFERFKKETEERLQQLTPAEFKLENSRRQALRATGKKGLPSLKDPNAPKRPLSGFFRFAQDLRKSGEYANMPVNEQAKAFAEAWSKASDSVKTPYNQASHAALQKYKEEKAVYDDQK